MWSSWLVVEDLEMELEVAEVVTVDSEALVAFYANRTDNLVASTDSVGSLGHG